MSIDTDSFDHDDGLVHGHAWASSTSPGAPAASLHAGQDGTHDDGLVHDHLWAAT
jgi:hypothetical protein